ncbi:Arylacetamide deacetylase [Handroanthus impetiginosus]|uniref:Arylacetamide deacetylase n=1 Tax=Handroanthus impetiginosus TaxID=429701 RepID=A0A2G9HZ85_9LAMI|nr:Arylacetamide deacetylase [Handroanthus impetiginosus]
MSKFDPYEHLNISLNPDGSLTRFIKLPSSKATGGDAQIPGQAVISKDVTLNAEKRTWMRLYRPSKLPSARIPIILYFHPGGWIQMSVADTMIHENSNRISAEVPAIFVAVEFRPAPEHRLPVQYEDAMDAIVWVKNQASDRARGDPWIRDYGDLSRCYLYGVSCGANIAFNAALRLPEMKPQPLKINGTILNQPLFGGKKRTKSELKFATDQYFPLPVQDLLWELALPIGTDRDHRYCNPFVDGPMKEKVKNLGRCLVIGFGGDPLIDRQQEFVQMLVEQGVPVEARFDDVGFHGIDLIDSRRAIAILKFIKEFV